MIGIFMIIKNILSLNLVTFNTTTSISYCYKGLISKLKTNTIFNNSFEDFSYNLLNNENELVGYCKYSPIIPEIKKEDFLVCLENSFFNNQNFVVSSYSFIIPIDQFNELVVYTPIFFLEDEEKDLIRKKSKTMSYTSDTLFNCNYTYLMIPSIKNEENFKQLLNNIINDISENKLYTLFKKNNLILFLLQDIEYAFIIFNKLKDCLKGNFEESNKAVLQMLEQESANNFDFDFFKSKCSFINSEDITDEEKKSEYKWLLLTDIINIIFLSTDKNLKFRIAFGSSENQNVEFIACVKFQFNLKDCTNFNIKKLEILSENNSEIQYYDYIKISDTISLYFNLECLLEKQVKSIRLIYLDKNIKYECGSVDIKMLLNT